jgi:hypothetical protein
MRRLGISKDQLNPANWAIYPTLRSLWPWFAGFGALLLVAIPWGIRAQERGLEQAARVALAEAHIPVENIVFSGRNATVYADFNVTMQRRTEAALADVSGIRNVAFAESDVPLVPVTSTSTTSAPTTTATTTTTPVGEPAGLTLTVSGGRVVLQGALPDARTVASISRVATALYEPSVTNELVADPSLGRPLWLNEAPEAAAVLPMITDGALVLGNDGAYLTGTVFSDEQGAAVQTALQRALGPDIPVHVTLTVLDQNAPALEIVYSGDGSIVVRGTVANKDVKKVILSAVKTAGHDVTNELVVGKNTADVYAVRRVPFLVKRLNGAAQWALRFDGTALSGAVAGGDKFDGDKTAPTGQLGDLLVALGSMVEGNTTYELTLEVHSTAASGAQANRDLSRERLGEAVVYLVRAGTDPNRMATDLASGDGELLRFRIGPVDGE